MKIIGLDGKRAARNGTGLGNYSRYAVEMLALARPDWRFALYAAGDARRAKAILDLPNVELIGPQGFMNRRLPALWRTSGISGQLARDGIDLYHGLSNEIPRDLKIPSVVTIHDVIWRHVPQDYKPVDRWLYERKYGRSARESDHIIAISECTRRDIINAWDIDPTRISVVYQGVDPQFCPVAPEAVAAVRQQYRLPGRYIIAVGTVQSRKNQLLAVKALRDLPKDVKLVIVGRRTDYARELDEYAAKYGLTNRIVWLQGLPFAHLPALYAGAAAASYTSRYEGFGLPVVEAINSGTPVVAATGSCLEEAGGPGAFYLDPDDAEGAADAFRRLLEDSNLRQKMVTKGRAYTSRFSPEAFAEGTIAAYNQAIENHG